MARYDESLFLKYTMIILVTHKHCRGIPTYDVVIKRFQEDFMKKALVFWGGWNGHEPEQVATYISELLVGFIPFTRTCCNHG